MRNLILLFAFVLGLGSISAQDRGLFTQYYLNYELVNPAYSGFEGGHDLLFNYRNRWATFPGNPKMYTFAYDGRVADRIGIGAQVYGENIGALNRLRVQLQYAYLFGNEDFDFSLGLSTEYQQYNLDNSALVSPFYEAVDPVIVAASDNVTFFDATLGFHGVYQEDLFFGIAIPSLIRARLNDIEVAGVEQNVQSSFLEHYFVYLGYKFYMPNGDYHLEPSIAFKDVRGIDFQLDFNLKGLFLDEKLVGGLSYSTGAGNRLGFLVGTRIDNFQFTYSYDASFLDFQEFNAGGHEFTIGVTLGQKTNEQTTETMQTDKF